MQPNPLAAAGEGYVQSQFAPHIQHLWILRILLHHPQVIALRKIAAYIRERLSEVGGLEDVRVKVVEPMMFESDVGGSGGRARRLNPGDLGKFRNIGRIPCDV